MQLNRIAAAAAVAVALAAPVTAVAQDPATDTAIGRVPAPGSVRMTTPAATSSAANKMSCAPARETMLAAGLLVYS